MIYLPDLPGREPGRDAPEHIGLDYRGRRNCRTSDGVEHTRLVHVPGHYSPCTCCSFTAMQAIYRTAWIRLASFAALGLSVLYCRLSGAMGTEQLAVRAEAGMNRDAHLPPGNYLVNGKQGIDPRQRNHFWPLTWRLGRRIRLAARTKPLALIIESAFTSVPDIAQELYPWLPARWLSSHAARQSREYVVRRRTARYSSFTAATTRSSRYHHGRAHLRVPLTSRRPCCTLHGGHNDAPMTR